MALTWATNLDTLVREYIEPGLIDNYFTGTPVLDAIRATMKPAGGDVIQTLIEYTGQTAVSIADKAQLSSADEELTTRSQAAWRHYYADTRLSKWELELSHTPESLADLMVVKTKNAMKGMVKALSAKAFTDQATTNLDGITNACDDTTPFQGIATSDFAGWVCHTMEDDTATSGKIAPSITNVKRMIRHIALYCGEKPDMMVVHPNLYDIVEAQVDDNDMVSMIRLNNGVEVGYDAININGVKMVADLDCPGSAWSSGARADGYEIFFLNWNYLWLANYPGTSFKWEGWRQPHDYRDLINYLWFDGNFVCSQRRALGRIFNIDITIDPASWVAGTIV